MTMPMTGPRRVRLVLRWHIASRRQVRKRAAVLLTHSQPLGWLPHQALQKVITAYYDLNQKIFVGDFVGKV